MTNFEAWQKTLPESERGEKVEDLIVDRGEECNDPDDDRYVIGHDCRVCPITEPEPKPVTYRELSRWLAEGNGEVNDELDDAIYTYKFYWKGRENDAVVDSIQVRKWDDTEWHKPTRKYLGLEDK